MSSRVVLALGVYVAVARGVGFAVAEKDETVFSAVTQSSPLTERSSRRSISLSLHTVGERERGGTPTG